MKATFIQYKNDNKQYRLPQMLGIEINKIEEPEQIDLKIEELKNQEYTTIIIPNELASFSEKITNQYKYDPIIIIIITSTKKLKAMSITVKQFNIY